MNSGGEVASALRERDIWRTIAVALTQYKVTGVEFGPEALKGSHVLRVFMMDWETCDQKEDLREGIPSPSRRKKGYLDVDDLYMPQAKDKADSSDVQLGDLREHVDTLASGFCDRFDKLERRVGSLAESLEGLAKRVTTLETLPQRLRGGPYIEPL
jgi:hypothetical protein